MKSFYLLLTLLSLLEATDERSLLFHGNCITCHFEQEAVSAPSIVQIRENYLRAFPQKEEFVEYMSKWIEKPDKKGSIMLDAVKKYALMPELGYDISTLREISAYIYDTDFTKEHEGHKD